MRGPVGRHLDGDVLTVSRLHIAGNTVRQRDSLSFAVTKCGAHVFVLLLARAVLVKFSCITQRPVIHKARSLSTGGGETNNNHTPYVGYDP